MHNIEFSFHQDSLKYGRIWHIYSPLHLDELLSKHFNYWLKIDGKIHVTWTPEMLIDAIEKDKIWKKLSKTA